MTRKDQHRIFTRVSRGNGEGSDENPHGHMLQTDGAQVMFRGKDKMYPLNCPCTWARCSRDDTVHPFRSPERAGVQPRGLPVSEPLRGARELKIDRCGRRLR